VRAAIWLGEGSVPSFVLHMAAEALPTSQAASRAARTARGPLRPLHEAVTRHRLHLSAHLTDMPVTLGDLVTLQVGDVLLSPHRLVEPMLVWAGPPPGAVAATQPTCTARLIQRDGHMAIQLANLAAPALASGATTTTSSEGLFMPNPSISAPLANDATSAQWLDLPAAAEPVSGGVALKLASNPLLGVKTSLSACVGSAVVTVGELSAARVGQVITLDREVDSVVDLLLDGQVVARGQLVAVDDFFGVRLTELPLPLAPTGDMAA